MKNRTLRYIAILMVTLLALGCLFGCGTSGDAPPTAAAGDGTDSGSADEPSTDPQPAPSGDGVTLSFLRAGTDENVEIAYNELIADYTTQNPDISVDYQQYNYGSELETKLNTLYASSSAPDVVRAPISTIAQRATMGQYAPLDAYIDGWAEKDDVIETAYEVGSYRGSRYGIAINIEASFLFYRKDHFEEAGLDPEQPPETWAELLDYAEQLTIRDGNNVTRMGMSLPMSQAHSTLIPFARQNGGILVDEDNDEAVFNEPATVEALEYLAAYGERNLLIPWINNKDQNPFELGNASITYGTLNTYTKILASGVDWADQMLYAPSVGKEVKNSFGGCQIMFISEDSQHKDEAWDFIEYLFTDDSVWKLVSDAGASPVKKNLADRFIEEYPDIGPTYIDALDYAAGMPKVEWAALFEKYICQAHEEAMYGQKDAQTALDDALAQLYAELGR